MGKTIDRVIDLALFAVLIWALWTAYEWLYPFRFYFHR